MSNTGRPDDATPYKVCHKHLSVVVDARNCITGVAISLDRKQSFQLGVNSGQKDWSDAVSINLTLYRSDYNRTFSDTYLAQSDLQFCP